MCIVLDRLPISAQSLQSWYDDCDVEQRTWIARPIRYCIIDQSECGKDYPMGQNRYLGLNTSVIKQHAHFLQDKQRE